MVHGNMNALVYGGGAVGLGIASCLIKTGANVTILVRSDTKNLLDTKGLYRTGIFGEDHARPGSFEAITNLDELADKSFDFILVCTKSFDTGNAASDIARHIRLLGENGKIVLFQNGWGNAELMAAHLARESIYSARVITGFVRPDKNSVNITVHADAIHIGSLFRDTSCDEIAPLCQAISGGGIGCINVRGIGRDLWAKMLYNCALNPLGAIFSVPYGALSEHRETRAIMDSVIREIYGIMEKYGFATHWKTPDEYCAVFYEDLVRLTASHESSMLQDLRAGKRTEIDALNGEVVRLSKNPEAETPVNQMLANMIGFISSRNRIPG
jgi:2-dehydropantoate 2-reductase